MKKVLLLLIIACTVISSFALADLTDGLVAYWTFDELSGNTAHDSIGNNNGTLLNGPIWTSGKVNGAIYFDGGNDYVEIDGYEGIVGGASRTCTAWIKTSSSSFPMIMSWGEQNTGEKWMFHLRDTGALAIGVCNGCIEGDDSGLNDGNWHHVAAVLESDGNPTLDEIKLYVDGIKQTSSFYNYIGNPPLINTAATRDVTVGARFVDGLSPLYLDGFLDDVRIYNRALSTEEIGQLYSIPEPATLLLLGLGGLLIRKR